jgi:hypothetical protein
MATMNTVASVATMSREELQAYIARLEATVAETAKSGRPPLTISVGEKGGASLYGLGKFPVTLYYEQWTALLAAVNGAKVRIKGLDGTNGTLFTLTEAIEKLYTAGKLRLKDRSGDSK